MEARFASVTSEELIQINVLIKVYIISLFQYILEQLFTSVSVAKALSTHVMPTGRSRAGHNKAKPFNKQLINLERSVLTGKSQNETSA